MKSQLGNQVGLNLILILLTLENIESLERYSDELDELSNGACGEKVTSSCSLAKLSTEVDGSRNTGIKQILLSSGLSVDPSSVI